MQTLFGSMSLIISGLSFALSIAVFGNQYLEVTDVRTVVLPRENKLNYSIGENKSSMIVNGNFLSSVSFINVGNRPILVRDLELEPNILLSEESMSSCIDENDNRFDEINVKSKRMMIANNFTDNGKTSEYAPIAIEPGKIIQQIVDFGEHDLFLEHPLGLNVGNYFNIELCLRVGLIDSTGIYHKNTVSGYMYKINGIKPGGKELNVQETRVINNASSLIRQKNIREDIFLISDTFEKVFND